MEQTLYLECNSGISGDMTVAALLDLGADAEVLKRALNSLHLQGFEIEISRVKKAGLDVCDFNVKLDKELENHDDDMEYLYGHIRRHEHTHGDYEHTHQGHIHTHGDCEHTHEEHEHMHGDYGHTHSDQEHIHKDHGHHHGNHEHRGLTEIINIIEQADMSIRAKSTAKHIFQVLAQAEAKAHGMPVEQVHFHEVGAIDSILDIIAAAVCLDNLDITEVIIPYLCEGTGTVRCQHGILPIPVPAVANIMTKYEFPMKITDIEGELVTPTGAAIAAAIRTSETLPETFMIHKIGIGAGKRNYKRPSLLRAMLIGNVSESKSSSDGTEDLIYKLETNIDDGTGETLGYVMDRLLKSGARDVYYTPVFMKKNRPAYEMTVLCDKDKIEELEEIIFRETTTIGIRRTEMKRTILPRKADSIMLNYGELKVKKCILPNGEVRIYPEYESVAELAKKNNISFGQVINEFQRALDFNREIE
ncbi:MAG: nickel pincer cofactor biosynthesis protein LarC [Lachnospiraceae bacterium]|nr:nickel pincer cofactor biosynthesis protein LarC [Lachnospiraceae bacterium]